MSKNGTLIAILIVVFVVIAVVIYMFTRSNKDDVTKTVSTTKTGLSSIDPTALGGLIKLF